MTEGFQIVPIEPTPEMLKALRENEGENAWLAALAIAPRPVHTFDRVLEALNRR